MLSPLNTSQAAIIFEIYRNRSCKLFVKVNGPNLALQERLCHSKTKDPFYKLGAFKDHDSCQVLWVMFSSLKSFMSCTRI